MSARLIATLLFLAVVAEGSAAGQTTLVSYEVDVERSSLFLITLRAGLFSFLGHEHAIVPTEWTAELCLANPIPRRAHGRVLIRTPSLVIDTEWARALAGLGSGPVEDDLPELQAKMLDVEHLDAQAYPEILVMIDSVAPDGDSGLAAVGHISLHGITREVNLSIGVASTEGGMTQLSGALRVRQRDYGIEPESKAGLVKVSNDVDLHFVLVAAPTQQPCASTPGTRFD